MGKEKVIFGESILLFPHRIDMTDSSSGGNANKTNYFLCRQTPEFKILGTACLRVLLSRTKPFRVNMMQCSPGNQTLRGLCPWRLGEDTLCSQQQPPSLLHRLLLQSRRDWSQRGGHFCTKKPGISDKWLFSKFNLKELGFLHMIS